jgi:hypothetical protein
MNYPTINDAILELKPNACFQIVGEQIYENIIWINKDETVTKEEAETKHQELIELYNSLEYQRKRKPEYPSIEDQLDDIYHNGIDSWKETIKAVKDKYPKG